MLAAIASIAAPVVAGETAPYLEAALSVQQARAEQAPRDPAILTDLGNLQVMANHPEAAEESYRAALELNPDFVPARYNFALLLEETGRLKAAKRHYRKLVKDDPSFARGWYGIGRIHSARKHNPKAIVAYSKAFRLDPELLEVESHPELVLNEQRTWAMAHAYLQPTSGLTTRHFAQPEVAVKLLAPDLAAPSAETLPTPAAEEVLVDADVQDAESSNPETSSDGLP